MDSLRRLLRILLPLSALMLAALPTFVVFRVGWVASGQSEASSLERWVLLAVFDLAWVLALAVLVIWCNDRLGVHWHAWDRAPLGEKRRRRRRAAGMRFLEGQESARREPPLSREKDVP